MTTPRPSVADLYTRVIAPIWLDAAQLTDYAASLRGLPPLTEETTRQTLRTLWDVRKPLSKRRKGIKHMAKTATWDVYRLHDIAWNVARAAAYEPGEKLLPLAPYAEKFVLRNAAHCARAAAWHLAWQLAREDPDHADGDTIWNQLQPPRIHAAAALAAAKLTGNPA